MPGGTGTPEQHWRSAQHFSPLAQLSLSAEQRSPVVASVVASVVVGSVVDVVVGSVVDVGSEVAVDEVESVVDDELELELELDAEPELESDVELELELELDDVELLVWVVFPDEPAVEPSSPEQAATGRDRDRAAARCKVDRRMGYSSCARGSASASTPRTILRWARGARFLAAQRTWVWRQAQRGAAGG